MSSEVFWNLSWYDWTLWMYKIIEDRKKRNVFQEFEWIRLSHLETLIAMVAGNKNAKPTDFYTPSWNKDHIESVKDERSNEEVLSKFPKKLK